MAIVFSDHVAYADSSINDGGSGSVSVVVPTHSEADGDILVVVGRTTSVPAGWSSIYTSGGHTILYKVLGIGEPASYLFTPPNIWANQSLHSYLVKGAADPATYTVVSGASPAASGGTAIAPAITAGYEGVSTTTFHGYFSDTNFTLTSTPSGYSLEGSVDSSLIPVPQYIAKFMSWVYSKPVPAGLEGSATFTYSPGWRGGIAYHSAWVTQPEVTVLTPNGGEELTPGVPYNITWSSINLTDSLLIEYSADDFVTPVTIVASTTNDGLYEWTVPNLPGDYKIRITCTTDASITDVSDAVFTIPAVGATEIGVGWNSNINQLKWNSNATPLKWNSNISPMKWNSNL